MIRAALFGMSVPLLAMLATGPALATPSITGLWARGDGNAHVRIAPCGANLCATNVWVKPGLKNEAIGDTLVMMVKPAGETRYAGEAFDRRRKLTYQMEIAVQPAGLTSRGCVLGGIACRATTWTRLR